MNYLRRCIRLGVEDESCVIPFYMTTLSQRDILLRYLSASSSYSECLPLYWKIEVADQHNGWFEGVALHYRVSDHSFHIIIRNSNSSNNTNGNNNDKDKLVEAYNDYLAYDHRVIRLVECCDYYSKPLFNQFVRDSVISVQWDIDWLEDYSSSLSSYSPSVRVSNVPQHAVSSYSSRFGSHLIAGSQHSNQACRLPKRKWNSRAICYLRALNVVLVDRSTVTSSPASSCSPYDPTNEIPRNYVMLYLDENICLHQCHDSVSWNEFRRLVMDEPDILSSIHAKQQVSDVKRWSNVFFASATAKVPSLASVSSKVSSVSANPFNSCAVSVVNKKEDSVISGCHTCVICLENDISNIAFIPCGHQVVCEGCSSTVINRKAKYSSFSSSSRNVLADHLCPICRSSVQSCLRVYKV
jgi:hypothetical protein